LRRPYGCFEAKEWDDYPSEYVSISDDTATGYGVTNYDRVFFTFDNPMINTGAFATDDSNLAAGDNVTVIGYPAAGDYDGTKLMSRPGYVGDDDYVDTDVIEMIYYSYGGDSGSIVFDSLSQIRAIHVAGSSGTNGPPRFAKDFTTTDTSDLATTTSDYVDPTAKANLVADLWSSDWAFPSTYAWEGDFEVEVPLWNVAEAQSGEITVSLWLSDDEYFFSTDNLIGEFTTSSIGPDSKGTISVAIDTTMFPQNSVNGATYYLFVSFSCVEDEWDSEYNSAYVGQVTVSSVEEDSSSSSSTICFGSESVVVTSNGERKFISEIEVGEEIMTLNRKREIEYQPVIFKPHTSDNQIEASFIHMTTESEKVLKATEAHLVLVGDCEGDASDFKLVEIGKVYIDQCVISLSNENNNEWRNDRITKLEKVAEKGVHTVITLNPGDMVIVDGVVASSFEDFHVIPNMFYKLHRFAYSLLGPDLMNGEMVNFFTNSIAGRFASFFGKFLK